MSIDWDKRQGALGKHKHLAADVLSEDTGEASVSGGLLQSATVTLTDAQVKALPTTPFQLVAPQGVGTAICPMSIVLVRKPLGGSGSVYSNVSSDPAAYMVMSDEGDIQEMGGYWIGTELAAFFTNWDGIVVHQGQPSDVPAGHVVPETLPEDSGIYLYVDNSGLGNFTGGNAGNGLQVTVQYVVIDL